MTDAISPEFCLQPDSIGSFALTEWQIDDDHDFAFHKPTRAAFSLYRTADATDLTSISIYQMRVRLSHVCDGSPVPPDLPALAAAAIIAFAYLTPQFRPVEMRPWHPAFATGRFRAIFEPGP